MVVDELISILLKNRGLTTPGQIADFFLPPDPAQIPLSQVGLSPASVAKAGKLINRHLAAGHPIAIYGDYDVDGLCATAILWETLYSRSPQVFPHIPHRRDEGYGLSLKGINHCLAQGAKLIIAVDSGITAHKEIAYSQKKGCDILVIDHHQPEKTLPRPTVLLHSTTTTAAGLAWFFTREL